MWRSIVVNSQEEFRSQGWNLAGGNLLALGVGLANRHYLYVRPRLTPRDFGYAMGPMVIGTILASLIAYLSSGTTVLAEMAVLGCVLGLLVGGGSIVWKLSQWQPVERLLAGTASGRKMERSLQFELVDKLTQVCERHRIDPDKLDELLATFDGSEPDPGEPASDFVDAILDFFSTHMKMQE